MLHELEFSNRRSALSRDGPNQVAVFFFLAWVGRADGRTGGTRGNFQYPDFLAITTLCGVTTVTATRQLPLAVRTTSELIWSNHGETKRLNNF